MPRWLLAAYRLATALAILMLIAATASLVALAFLGVSSLWHWGLVRLAGWQGLFAWI